MRHCSLLQSTGNDARQSGCRRPLWHSLCPLKVTSSNLSAASAYLQACSTYNSACHKCQSHLQCLVCHCVLCCQLMPTVKCIQCFTLPASIMLTCNAWFAILYFLALVSKAAHWADHNSSPRGEHLICLKGFFKRHWPFFHRVALGGCQLQYRASRDTGKNCPLNNTMPLIPEWP